MPSEHSTTVGGSSINLVPPYQIVSAKRILGRDVSELEAYVAAKLRDICGEMEQANMQRKPPTPVETFKRFDVVAQEIIEVVKTYAK